MKNQTVAFTAWKEKRFSYRAWSNYAYFPEQGWAWAQRLCFKFLAWRKCFSVIDGVTFRQVTVNADNFGELLLKQYDAAAHIYNERVTKVYCGPEDFYKIIELGNGYATSSIVTFNANARLGGDQGVRVFELPVKVLPWMKGVLFA